MGKKNKLPEAIHQVALPMAAKVISSVVMGKVAGVKEGVDRVLWDIRYRHSLEHNRPKAGKMASRGRPKQREELDCLELAKKCREYREMAGLSLKEAAEELNAHKGLGLYTDTLWSFENGDIEHIDPEFKRTIVRWLVILEKRIEHQIKEKRGVERLRAELKYKYARTLWVFRGIA